MGISYTLDLVLLSSATVIVEQCIILWEYPDSTQGPGHRVIVFSVVHNVHIVAHANEFWVHPAYSSTPPPQEGSQRSFVPMYNVVVHNVALY